MAKMCLVIESTDRSKVPEKAQKIRDEMWNRLWLSLVCEVRLYHWQTAWSAPKMCIPCSEQQLKLEAKILLKSQQKETKLNNIKIIFGWFKNRLIKEKMETLLGGQKTISQGYANFWKDKVLAMKGWGPQYGSPEFT